MHAINNSVYAKTHVLRRERMVANASFDFAAPICLGRQLRLNLRPFASQASVLTRGYITRQKHVPFDVRCYQMLQMWKLTMFPQIPLLCTNDLSILYTKFWSKILNFLIFLNLFYILVLFYIFVLFYFMGEGRRGQTY